MICLTVVCRLLTSWSCSDWRPIAPSRVGAGVMPFRHRYKTKMLPAISATAIMEIPKRELLSSSSPATYRDDGNHTQTYAHINSYVCEISCLFLNVSLRSSTFHIIICFQEETATALEIEDLVEKSSLHTSIEWVHHLFITRWLKGQVTTWAVYGGRTQWTLSQLNAINHWLVSITNINSTFFSYIPSILCLVSREVVSSDRN